jgi:hypothetical protein
VERTSVNQLDHLLNLEGNLLFSRMGDIMRPKCQKFSRKCSLPEMERGALDENPPWFNPTASVPASYISLRGIRNHHPSRYPNLTNG